MKSIAWNSNWHIHCLMLIEGFYDPRFQYVLEHIFEKYVAKFERDVAKKLRFIMS